MPSRRSEIAMTADEVRAYLEAQDKLIITSNGLRGFPHPVPMNFVFDDGCFHMTTFRKSQKIRNIERDPRVAILVETGHAYRELKSVLAYGEAGIIDDSDTTLAILMKIGGRGGAQAFDVEAVARATAPKRVVISCRPAEIISWDHARLAGAY
jgi:nitroimidazol reductase NimA-like FMN-containing flavoprotein (pyridoxamine 5'-phosphate oxidase superfamily)